MTPDMRIFSNASVEAMRELSSLLGNREHLESWDPTLLGKAPHLRTHLDPARTNILRSLAIDSTMTVLEVGAGSGILSRYLGERALAVDALETDGALAQLARLRLQGLNNVEVLEVHVSDLPGEAAYDVIVAIGAMRAAAGADARAELLSTLTKLLTPTGTIVLAETNRLGLKYLLGSPDESTGRVFDSIENYPFGGNDRALSRADLEATFDRVGLQREYLLAMPDHVFTRSVVRSAVLGPDMYPLASQLAMTPSPDLNGARPKLSDERRVWDSVVDAGLHVDLSNSWLIVATRTGNSPLLVADELAVFHSWHRAARYTAQTTVRRRKDGVVFERVYPHSDPHSSLFVEDSQQPLIAGRSLLSLMVDADLPELESLMQRWRAALERHTTKRLWLDMHPGNLILDDSGQLVPIDLEYATVEGDIHDAVGRTLLYLAHELACRRPITSWPKGVTHINHIALWLGSTIGREPSSGWFADAMAFEAKFQFEVLGERNSSLGAAHILQQVRQQMEKPLVDTPYGPRVFEGPRGSLAERNPRWLRGVKGVARRILRR